MGIGLSMQVVAIGWYIYDVTNSALALGLSGLATFLPPAIFALFTGHVADTYSRRLIVTTAFSVYAICSLGLLLLVLNKSSQVWLIYGLIFIGSTGRAFSNPASQALTPNTVPKELFANAVTWYSAAWSASRIVGPAIGGILYVFGAAVPFFLIFIAFVTATFCVWSISISGMEDRKGGRGPISMETLLAGLRFIFTHKVLLENLVRAEDNITVSREDIATLASWDPKNVGETEIAELNDTYMGKQGPTDVLSFPIDAAEAEMVLHGEPPSRGPDRSPPDPADMPLLLGDVVVCPAVAQAQAPTHAGTLDDELALRSAPYQRARCMEPPGDNPEHIAAMLIDAQVQRTAAMGYALDVGEEVIDEAFARSRVVDQLLVEVRLFELHATSWIDTAGA